MLNPPTPLCGNAPVTLLKDIKDRAATQRTKLKVEQNNSSWIHSFQRMRILAFAAFFLTMGFDVRSQCENLPGWIVSHETCFDANDGTICCNTSGGVFPVSCSITPNNGSYNTPTHCFTGLSPNSNYVVDVTYNNGCSTQISGLEILENTSSAVVLNPTIIGSCNGGGGQVCVNPTGGYGNYSYAWESTPVFSVPYLSSTNCTGSVSPGTYYLRFRDYNPTSDNNCEIQVPYTVLDNTPSLSAVVNPTSNCDCPGGDGSIDLTPSGGNGSYTYAWSGPNGFTSSSQDISNLCEGTYSVVVTSEGCSVTQNYVVGGLVVDFTGDLYVTSSSDLMWTSSDYFGADFVIDGNVFVQAGANLQISGVNVKLTSGHIISIAANATLSAENYSTFDAACDPTWRGFRVHGVGVNPSSAQQSQRGRLYLQDATVSHAECAITNYELSISGGGQHQYVASSCTNSGGNIYCIDVEFLDNVRDLSLKYYVPQVGDPVPPYSTYLAQFETCIFKLDLFPSTRESTALTAQSPRIEVERVAEVYFADCFGLMTTTNQYSAGTNASVFLQSTKSYFDWYGCVNPANYNQNICNAEVNGFTRAFVVQSRFNTSFGLASCDNITASNINNVIHISGTDFECVQAIHASDVENIRALNNNITDLNVAHNSTPSANRTQISIVGTYGIDSDFRIAGNNFSSLLAFTSPYRISPALYINNGGGRQNFVMDNSLTNFATGMSFLNENRADAGGGYTANGLHYECNSFEGCQNDVTMYSQASPNINRRGVASRQARFWNPQEFNTSAGNNFNGSFYDPSPFTKDDVNMPTLYTSPQHEYVYYFAEIDDNNQTAADPTGTPTEMSGTVQDLFSITDPEIEGSINPCDYQYNQSDFTGVNFNEGLEFARTAYIEQELLAESIRDGGATIDLLAFLDAYGYQDAWETYSELISKSPNLSEAVMVKIVESENLLPNSLLAVVLASNPQATKLPSVVSAIENKGNAFDSYQLSIIENGRNNPLSPLEILEKMKAHSRFEEVRLLSDYEEFLLSDESEGNEQELINYLHPEEFYEDLIKVAQWDYQNGDIESGNDRLLQAADMFKLDSETANRLDQYVYLYNLEKSILETQGGVLTPSQYDELENLWFTEPFGAGLYAVNMLVHFAGYQPEWPGIPENGEDKSLRRKNIASESVSSVSPNPAQEIAVVKFILPCIGQESVSLYNPQGQLIQETIMKPGQKEISLNLVDLPSGIYLITCRDQIGSQISSHSLIKF